MARKQFSNNALTTLASSISAVANSCSATSGGGSLFPAITSGSGNSFQMTFLKIVSGAVTAQEIVTVTARTGDVLSITRAQESTTALSWNAGDQMALLPTAGDLTAFMQAGDIQAQSGNYAVDTGTANAYVAAVSPALTAHVVGMPIVWKATNPNNGASTFSDGFGIGNLLTPNLKVLLPGMVQTGGIYESVWDGTEFQLLNPSGATGGFGQFTGTLTGVSGAPTAAFVYSIASGMATLAFATGGSLLGTSTGVSMTVTGLACNFAACNVLAHGIDRIVEDSGSRKLATMGISPGSNIITFFLMTTFVGSNPIPITWQAPFTNGGTKGLNSEFSVTYPLL